MLPSACQSWLPDQPALPDIKATNATYTTPRDTIGAYSTDLRERVLRTCARGRLSRARIAALFQVAGEHGRSLAANLAS